MTDEPLVVTIGLDGRVVIPTEAREALGLEPGTEVEVRRHHVSDRDEAVAVPSPEWIDEVLSDVLIPDDRVQRMRRSG